MSQRFDEVATRRAKRWSFTFGRGTPRVKSAKYPHERLTPRVSLIFSQSLNRARISRGMTFNMYTRGGEPGWPASVGEKFVSKANLWLSEHEVNPHFRQFVIQISLCSARASLARFPTFKQTGNTPIFSRFTGTVSASNSWSMFRVSDYSVHFLSSSRKNNSACKASG